MRRQREDGIDHFFLSPGPFGVRFTTQLPNNVQDMSLHVLAYDISDQAQGL